VKLLISGCAIALTKNHRAADAHFLLMMARSLNLAIG
jgi:hypothetical protein